MPGQCLGQLRLKLIFGLNGGDEALGNGSADAPGAVLNV